MPYPEKTARNEQIFHLIEHGHTFAEVAAIFDINPHAGTANLQCSIQKKSSGD